MKRMIDVRLRGEGDGMADLPYLSGMVRTRTRRAFWEGLGQSTL